MSQVKRLFGGYPLVTDLDDGDLLAAGTGDGQAVKNITAANLALAAARRLPAVVPDTVTGQNKGDAALAPGQPLAVHASGVGFVAAAATGPRAAGVCRAGANPGAVATLQAGGILSLSDWTAATGAAELAARAVYYLSATPGQLSTTPPAAAGQLVQVVGRALSPADLEISVGEPILL